MTLHAWDNAQNGRATLETSAAMVRTFEGGSNVAQGTCSVEGCERSALARAMCRTHYNHWYATRADEPRCSVEECDSPAIRRGWCALHVDRWRKRGGDPAVVMEPGPRKDGRPRGWRSPRTALERLLARTAVGPGCWIWQGKPSPDGYSTVMVGSRSDGTRRLEKGHRVAYEALVGPIPDGLDHVRERGCVSTLCVNPAHLEPVTRSENSRRMNAWRKANA